jgi:hypothetical protein
MAEAKINSVLQSKARKIDVQRPIVSTWLSLGAGWGTLFWDVEPPIEAHIFPHSIDHPSTKGVAVRSKKERINIVEVGG